MPRAICCDETASVVCGDCPRRLTVEQAVAGERERCARHIELIAADWRESGADPKVWAAEYLAREIRDLPPALPEIGESS